MPDKHQKMAGRLGKIVLVAVVGLVACSSTDAVNRPATQVIRTLQSSTRPVDASTPFTMMAQASTESQHPGPGGFSTGDPKIGDQDKLENSGIATALAVTPESTTDRPSPETLSSEITQTISVASKEITATQGVEQIIGFSYDGRPISSYRFGHGTETVIFVGGIHGGYEWNTIMLAYQAIDYFLNHPGAVPEQISLYIVPSANPDGQFLVTESDGRFGFGDVGTDTASGRFNGHGVDLNRNWNCNWDPDAFWLDEEVSGGARPFSEPESQAMRDFFLDLKPRGVVFWHSSADGVYGAGCSELFLPARALAEAYSGESGYPVYDQFTSYSISGDAGDWLTRQGIPSITVELATHDQVEWTKNLAGILAVLDYFDRQPGRIIEP